MEEPSHLKGRALNKKILEYYKANEVQKYIYNRPFRKGPKDKDNEFAVIKHICFIPLLGLHWETLFIYIISLKVSQNDA